jgi:hypothetical protein
MTTAKVKCSLCGELLDHSHPLGEFNQAEIKVKKNKKEDDA